MRTYLALALATFASASVAQTNPQLAPRDMMSADGIQTREQAGMIADAQFDRMDTNHDGQLSPDERATSRPMRAGVAPQSSSGERTVTRAQFHARALARFDRMDANHDGKVDATERAAFRAMQRERREAREGAETKPAP